MTAAAAAVVHASDRTRVTRLTLDERTVIRKEPLGTDAQRRLRHEVGMLERLRGAEGVAQLVDAPQYPDSIVMEDAGRTTLAELAKPLDTDDLIALAVQLARALAAMHGRGVMHRDIAPANIVVSASGAPCLVDFALATAFAEIRPEFTHHSEIVGALPYLAPEQTGRTGRPVDQRADLYALGATLYELATGEPPFGSGDPLRLTHDHLARVPVAPAEANAAIPGTLSEIVMHLLEKEPDSRYQSAEGVLYDLERLRDGQAGPIGAHDVPPRLLAPSRLVGRDDEVAALEAAFEAARTGQLSGGAGHRRARGRQDGARQRAAAGRDGPRRLVRGGQVRPVPARPRVRRGLSGVPRPGPAAAGGAGGRVGGASRADPGGARSQRRAHDRGRARVRRAARCAAGSRGSADRTGTGAAERRGAAAGDRHPRTPARRVRRRSAMGGPHAARVCSTSH